MRTYEIQIESFKPVEARGKFKEVRKIQARNIEEATKIANEITHEILEKSEIAWEYRWEFIGVGQGHYITDWDRAFASMNG